MDKEQVLEQLTEEQRDKVERIDELLADPENQKKISAMTSVDEVIAFYEENGFSFTEEQKKEIREKSEELAARSTDDELTEEELENVAGGWGWGSFFKFGGAGGALGACVGVLAAGFMASNPIGWGILIGGAIGAGIFGVAGGFAN